MSDTPRTDDATWHTRTPGDPIGADVVYASFAAGLERELAAAIARIKRLDEAGDALVKLLNDDESNVSLMEWMKRANDVETAWTQAKEAR